MPQPPPEPTVPEPDTVTPEEVRLTERFSTDAEGAYRDLLDLYSPVLLRMIRRLFRDRDEVMEVYTAVCERLQAQDYAALRRFRAGSPIRPWLSVIVGNAAHDRKRRTRTGVIPETFYNRLTPFEKSVYRLHFYHRLANTDIAEVLASREAGITADDVQQALDRIHDLLGDERRWRLMEQIALQRRTTSVDAMIEMGLDPLADDYEEGRERQDRRAALAAALESMTPEDQLLLHLRFEQNLSAPQIADIMGYSQFRYVYTRLSTAIDRMRRAIEKG